MPSPLDSLAKWMIDHATAVSDLRAANADLTARVEALEADRRPPESVLVSGPHPGTWFPEWWNRPELLDQTPGGRQHAWADGTAPTRLHDDGMITTRLAVADRQAEPFGGATGTHDAHIYLPPSTAETTLEFTFVLHDRPELPWDFGKSGKLLGLFGWHPPAGVTPTGDWAFWPGGHNWYPASFSARTVWFYTERDRDPAKVPLLGEYVYLGGTDLSDLDGPRPDWTISGGTQGLTASWLLRDHGTPAVNTPIRVRKTIDPVAGRIRTWVDDKLQLDVTGLPLMTAGPGTINGVNPSLMFGGGVGWGPRNDAEACDVSYGKVRVTR